MDQWLKEHLVCPRDHLGLEYNGDSFVCSMGHTYPCVDGIPILLLEEATPTHHVFHETLAKAAKRELLAADNLDASNGIDPYVQEIIVGTCGNLYRSLHNNLTRYPIPEIRLPQGNGEHFLEIGCNWGRWCVSAAQKGYRPIGIDPSLDSIIAARKVARQLGIDVEYIVADSRYLPFANGSFEIAFSYSVFQHLYRDDARQSIAEMGRVLQPSGVSLVQMPNSYGLHNLWVQLRHRFKEPGFFDARYWRPSELKSVFSEYIGPTALSVDGYFSLNPQTSDLDLLPFKYRMVVSASEVLRKLSEKMPALLHIADSLYIHSTRNDPIVVTQ